MLGNILFAIGLIVSTGIGFVYFRDLGDITQIVLKVKRENMIRFIRHEYQILGVGLGAILLMVFAHLAMGGGTRFVFWLAFGVLAILYIFPWVWVHVGLRNQLNTAKYYSIQEAAEIISPGSTVLVMENNGVARAHPDSQLLRSHLAGDSKGLDGENVVMTYCAMANLGVGYTPEIEGETLNLEVLAQHGNNLILRDNSTGEPIQHIYGYRENAGPSGASMKSWPTFRMTFGSFQRAYPEGMVYLNRPSDNLFLRLFDMLTETVFSAGIARQHNEARPVMDNMTRYDDRLHTKTYVWGVNIGEDAVCYTRDFLLSAGNLVHATIGGREIVIVNDPLFDSIGAWYNDTGESITEVDFFGNSNQGVLKRVESMKPGMFWHVWVEFFPHTDINRAHEKAEAK